MIAGAQLFFDGVRLASDRRLLRYTWVPVLIAGAIVGAGLTFAFGYVTDLSNYLVAMLPSWLDFLGLVLAPLLYLLGLLVGAWLLGLLAVLLSSPFLGDLSIEVERLKYPDAPVHPPDFWRGVVTALRREARKLAYHLPRLLVVFILTLIPGVNAFAPFIWFLFGAWTMAVQFADYPAENRGLPFAHTLMRLRSKRTTALGFGACATLALAIPLVNFLLIPAAVAGGTLLWHQLHAEQP